MFVTQNTKGDNKEPPFLSSPEGLVECKWPSVPLPSCARPLLQGPSLLVTWRMVVSPGRGRHVGCSMYKESWGSSLWSVFLVQEYGSCAKGLSSGGGAQLKRPPGEVKTTSAAPCPQAGLPWVPVSIVQQSLMACVPTSHKVPGLGSAVRGGNVQWWSIRHVAMVLHLFVTNLPLLL